jgi:hypothetical protein
MARFYEWSEQERRRERVKHEGGEMVSRQLVRSLTTTMMMESERAERQAAVIAPLLSLPFFLFFPLLTRAISRPLSRRFGSA